MASLHPALKNYLARVSSLANEYEPSLFWERQLAEFRRAYGGRRLDELGPSELEQIVLDQSYGFERLPDGHSDPTKDPEYASAKRTLKELNRVTKQLSPNALGVSKDQWEHVRALDYLRSRDLVSEYEAFISPLGVRSSMPVARHFVYARDVHQLADAQLGGGPLDILEVGAGAGNLAYFLVRRGLVRSYTIVDLPEMLIHSGFTIQRFLPGADLSFDGVVRDNVPAPAFFFVTPQRLDDVPEEAFDLCLNFNSFMEMDETARDAYIRAAYRVGRRGAVFFNVNRRQQTLPQRDGEPFDNNPLLYPYDTGDRVLCWEEDDFQQATRSRFSKIPSLAIRRAAVINS